MIAKGQTKSPKNPIQVPNQSLLYGEESVEEQSPKKTPKTRRESKKSIAAANELRDAVTDYFKLFLEEHKLNSTDPEELVDLWNSKETQERLKNVIKLHMPEQEVAKPRKKKDPNEPKRGKSAYIFFGMEMRPKIKEQNPGIAVTEVSVKLGELWKKITPNRKKKFEKLADADKVRYIEEMKVYKPDAKMFKQGPKRNLTAFFHFCAEKRQEVKSEHPEYKASEVARQLGRMWREDFSDTESRQVWIDMASNDKLRYENEKKAWLEEHPEEVKVPKKKNKNILTELPIVVQEEILAKQESVKKSNKRKKSNESIQASGMLLFMKQARTEIQEENPEWNTSQIVAEMKKRWSVMSTKERAAYD